MCPSRFLPFYKIFHLYKMHKNQKRMIEITEVIINKPMKIKTHTILMMKREMKRERTLLQSEIPE